MKNVIKQLGVHSHNKKHFDDIKLTFDINCDTSNGKSEFDIAACASNNQIVKLYLLIDYSSKNANQEWVRVDHLDDCT
jgi:hypothetical protein